MFPDVKYVTSSTNLRTVVSDSFHTIVFAVNYVVTRSIPNRLSQVSAKGALTSELHLQDPYIER